MSHHAALDLTCHSGTELDRQVLRLFQDVRNLTRLLTPDVAGRHSKTPSTALNGLQTEAALNIASAKL